MLTRRQLLQMGLVGGAAVLLPWERAIVALAQSPSTTPFAVDLPIPAVKSPTSTDDTTDYYEVVMQHAEVEILPGVLTPVWAYDGLYPGPTIKARRDRTVVVTQVNELDVDASVHNHGAHVRPEDDGHPVDLIPPGGQKVYTYPNLQRAASLWYHDHVMHVTSRNVYMGLAAFYLIGDEVEDALDLPTGEYDIPIVIQDRSFEEDGTLRFVDSINSVLGNTIVVNGKPWPRLEVANRKYRLRFLNGSNTRDYELALDSGDDLVQIGTDGGLMPEPNRASSIMLSPAERVEIVIDFADVPVGDSVVLKNLIGNPNIGLDDIMRFDVVRSEDDPVGAVPPTLRPVPERGPARVTRDFDMDFSDELGLWVINGQPFDEDRIDVRPQLDVPEIWRVHNSAGAPHPFHIHQGMFQVVDRDGEPPLPAEIGMKDTVQVNPGETVSFHTVLTRYTGVYVYHCHNLAHEDHDMMAQMEIVPADIPEFSDIAGHTHEEAILAVATAGITTGFPDGTFRPQDPVTRGQMAAFLQRALELPSGAGGGQFSDVGGHTHEEAIAAVAAAEIAAGFPDGTYRPQQPVSRDQMASFLQRALDLPPGGPHPFTDVAGNPHEPAIAAVAQEGIASGFPDGTYRPRQQVTRGQMAAFLARALDMDTPTPA
ncbi:MAG: S-layer homology domain-containing protein [Egibacteraceae bacterium]